MLGASGQSRPGNPPPGFHSDDPEPSALPQEPPLPPGHLAALATAVRPLPGPEQPRGEAQPSRLSAGLRQGAHAAGETGPPLLPARGHGGNPGDAAPSVLSA